MLPEKDKVVRLPKAAMQRPVSLLSCFTCTNIDSVTFQGYSKNIEVQYHEASAQRDCKGMKGLWVDGQNIQNLDGDVTKQNNLMVTNYIKQSKLNFGKGGKGPKNCMLMS